MMHGYGKQILEDKSEKEGLWEANQNTNALVELKGDVKLYDAYNSFIA